MTEPTRLPRWTGPLTLALMTLVTLGDALFGPRGRILSAWGADLTNHFVRSRAFGFSELSSGNLALWNPEQFSGYPYLGGFQPALFYPLNLPFLVLPLDAAINLNLTLHIFLAGLLAYVWASSNGCSTLSATLTGAVYMFCGRVFLHVYAGHVPHVCLLAWVPLLMLCIERLVASPGPGPVLVGAGTWSMMFLAGYPQLTYYASLAAGLYFVVLLVQGPRRVQSVVMGGALVVLALGVCTVQWWTGLNFVEESVRSGGASAGFTASFSLPPENLLTLVAPHALGPLVEDAYHAAYFGEAYPWETSAFVGVVALILALAGAATRGVVTTSAAVVALVMLVMALGANTPLHDVLTHVLPGYRFFRGTSKFLVLSSLMVALLAGKGLDALRSRQAAPSWLVAVTFVLALLLAGLAGWATLAARDGVGGGWHTALHAIDKRAMKRGDLFAPPQRLQDPGYLEWTAEVSSDSLQGAALRLVLVAVLLMLLRRHPREAMVGLLVLGLGELGWFARTNRAVAPMETSFPQAEAQLDAMLPSQRVHFDQSVYPQLASARRVLYAWGYDPGVLRRYAELMYAAHGRSPDAITSSYPGNQDVPPVFQLARVRQVWSGHPAVQVEAKTTTNPVLAEAQLVPHVMVIPRRDDVLKTVVSAGFDPATTVVLEQAVHPEPRGGAPQAVPIRRVDTDTIEIKVDVPAPSVLLLTEAYSRWWKARALNPPPAGQGEYRVLPANWAFQGVPLTTGKHHFRLEYAPPGFVTGRWVSLAFVALYAVLLAAWATRWRAKPQRAQA